ncbi:MAG: ABC transporter permease [Chloroflexia bacterium]|nr:ABC transporter permease [Chloroflexia bacterium]
MIRKALAVAWKELLILFRDRGQLAVLFLMPVMFASVIGSAFGGGTPGIAVYLVNLDDSPYSAQVVDILYQIEALRITELESVEEADRLLADGQALAAIIIPAELGQKIDAFERTYVEVMVDPTQQQYASIVVGIMQDVLAPVIVQGEVQHGIRTVMRESPAYETMDPQVLRMVEAQTRGVIMTQLRDMFENPRIRVEVEDLEGVEVRSLESAYSYTMPSYAVMFAFFIVGNIASTLLAEKEQGTFRRLLAAPLPRASLIAGNMLAYILVVFLQVAVVLGVGALFFGMPLGSSPLGLLLVTLALALAATALGMLVASLARTRSQADGIGFVLGLVLAAIGGAVVPIPDKGFLHLLSLLTPHAHAIEGILKLTSYGGGLVDVLPQVGLLSGVALLFFLVAMWRFRFE